MAGAAIVWRTLPRHLNSSSASRPFPVPVCLRPRASLSRRSVGVAIEACHSAATGRRLGLRDGERPANSRLRAKVRRTAGPSLQASGSGNGASWSEDSARAPAPTHEASVKVRLARSRVAAGSVLAGLSARVTGLVRAPGTVAKRTPVDDALLLDAQRRRLGEGSRLDAPQAALERRRPAPALDPHRAAGHGLQGIAGEQFGDHFQPRDFADLQPNSPRAMSSETSRNANTSTSPVR